MSSTTFYRTSTSTSLQSTSQNISIINIEVLCHTYHDNSTQSIIVRNYDGIPENLLINIVVVIILIFLYTFLRYIGDYGTFGLLKFDENKRSLESNDIKWYTKFSKRLKKSIKNKEKISDQTKNVKTSKSFDTYKVDYYKEKHLFSWFINMFKLKDKDIIDKCGKDAYYYSIFQRYIIVYLLLVSIITNAVLLPINCISGSNCK